MARRRRRLLNVAQALDNVVRQTSVLANLTKMGPRARGETLGKVRSEYMVFGDFVSHSPYVYAMTAYWVPLSKLHDQVVRPQEGHRVRLSRGGRRRRFRAPGQHVHQQ